MSGTIRQEEDQAYSYSIAKVGEWFIVSAEVRDRFAPVPSWQECCQTEEVAHARFAALMTSTARWATVIKLGESRVEEHIRELEAEIRFLRAKLGTTEQYRCPDTVEDTSVDPNDIPQVADGYRKFGFY